MKQKEINLKMEVPLFVNSLSLTLDQGELINNLINLRQQFNEKSGL